MIVNVQLHDLNLTGQLFADFFKAWANHLAWAAPFGPKIDQYGLAGCQHGCGEIIITYGFCSHVNLLC